jgi:AcrR family transcriptional regulator
MGSQLNTSVTGPLRAVNNTTAEKLLVAASELMIERSSIEVSLNDIAQKSGVNAALVKYHFGNVDPVLFYTSLIGACDHLFFGRHALARATGVGPVTDEVCRQYIGHMEALICGGMLITNAKKADAIVG